MADNSERPTPEGSSPDTCGDSAGKTETWQGDPTASTGNGSAAPLNDPSEALKREVAKCRLPDGLKKQVLAGLPPPEEHERLYRELKEQGGLAFADFFATLLEEVKSQS